MTRTRSRLAPSPTGFLHLGNARTFLATWLLARQAAGAIVLRIEDLDRPRVRPEMDQAALADLEWLGLDWDEGPLRQSGRLALYEEVFQNLRDRRLVYPCICTRKEVAAAASAPHAEDEGPVYPGTCRDRFPSAAAAQAASGRPPAWRFRVEPARVPFTDRYLGAQSPDPSRLGGDFVVRAFDGTFAYQLAVAVDDAAMGITEVVRGRDLVPSTPRQILLLRALGAEPPAYTHLPLVLDAGGRRMAKRRGDTELRTLRERGVDPRHVLALLARSLGMDGAPPAPAARDLVESFRLERIPAMDVTLPPLAGGGA